MKLVMAFIHHVRAPDVVEALGDAGYENITLQDVKGMLIAVNESEQEYSRDASTPVISETKLSLVCEDHEVPEVTKIIQNTGHIGPGISGWIYVSPVEQVVPIVGA